MFIKVFRYRYFEDSVIGDMFLDNEFFGFTLEDTPRPQGVKIKHKTAIGEGIYKIAITFSNRFQRKMPLLLDVPLFEGIRVHGGNNENNTSGCILLGENLSGESIHTCSAINKKFINLLIEAEDRGEHNYIEIVNTPQKD